MSSSDNMDGRNQTHPNYAHDQAFFKRLNEQQEEDRIKKLTNQLAEVTAERDQLMVQLAGCLAAAEGITHDSVIAKEGAYGWSLAYQKTLDCRRRLDRYRAALAEDQVGSVAFMFIPAHIRESDLREIIRQTLADRRRAVEGEGA